MTTFAKSQTPFGRPAFSWTLCTMQNQYKRQMKKILVASFTLLLLTLKFATCQNVKENFNSFMYQFGSDSEFQKSRIHFPLEFITWANPYEIGGEIDTLYIEMENWEHDYFYMNQSYRPQIYDNFDGVLKDTDERLFQWIGIETGVDVKYFFKRIDGKWFLIKKEQLGD
jgi:hypothetical protein